MAYFYIILERSKVISLMGKGDLKTRKGKINNNSYGNSRGKDNKPVKKKNKTNDNLDPPKGNGVDGGSDEKEKP